MRTVSQRGRWVPVLFVTAIATVGLMAGCGSSSESSSAKLSLKIIEEGKKSVFQAPKSTEGGLVEVTLTNQGKAPHGVQFIQYTGGHSEEEVLKELGGNSGKIPSWIKLQGGIGSVAGGQTGAADVKLPEGSYVLADAAAFSAPELVVPRRRLRSKSRAKPPAASPALRAPSPPPTRRRTSTSGKPPGSRWGRTRSPSTPRARRRST